MKIYPLTSPQRGLWVEWRLKPDSPAYNNGLRFNLRGDLDQVALRKALDLLATHYEALRTSFNEVNDIPSQTIHPSVITNLNYFDISKLTAEQKEIEEKKLLNMIFLSSFDLRVPPLFRYGLIKLEDNHYIFAITWHHIITDGLAMTELTNKLSYLYNAYLQNPDYKIMDQLSYGMDDFLKYESGLQSSLEKDSNHWQTRLKSASLTVDIANKSQKLHLMSPSRRIRFQLGEELTTNISRLVNSTKTTTFIIIASAFTVLMNRYTNQSDLVIGYLVNTREKTASNFVNFCINGLPLRVQTSDSMSFLEVIEQIALVRQQDKPHQYFPLDKLVQLIRKDDEITGSLFNVIVSQITMTCYDLKFNNMTCEPIVVENNYAKYDLTVLFDATSNIAVEFEYNTEKFDIWFIDQLIESFKLLLVDVTHNPSQAIRDVAIIPNHVSDKIIFDWNKTTVPFSTNFCLHELFTKQVNKTPHNIAVIFKDEQLSYSELNSKANQLAHYLTIQGIKEESFVAVCLERSSELIIAFLAILKCGGVYVPIDPNYPADRIDYILQDIQTSILLTSTRLLENWNSSDKQANLCLDRDWKQSISIQNNEDPNVQVNTQNLAYVIYTSGSTGKPKGVMNTHCAVVNRLLWMQAQYPLSEFDRVFHKTPFSFDVSVWELLWPLLVGAKLVIAEPGIHTDPLRLGQAIEQYQITTMHFVPSMLNIFLISSSKNYPSLRYIFASGEALPFEVKQNCLNRFHNCSLHNLYGPTEAAIDVSYWDCNNQSEIGVVPIGKPIANIQLYILDTYMQPVPIGVVGELYIGGIGLARGYLNRADLTAEKFVANPFDTQGGGSRLYRTGDLARFLNDGTIEYIGRIDNQVKIRGYRIELGEIETLIKQHAEILEALVVASENSGAEKRLVAYIVPRQSNAQSLGSLIDSLRQFLIKKLPEYMVPSGFMVLEQFPLNSNGKIDRRSLPVPDTYYRDDQEIYTAPQSGLETQLAEIWSKLLGLKIGEIGREDNFFKLGGHSLLATRLCSIIQKEFAAEISLLTLFDHASLRELANQIEASQGKSNHTNLLAARKRPAMIPLSYAQERLWFIDQLLPNNALYTVPIALKLLGTLKVADLRRSFESLIERHEILRTRFVSEAGLAKQAILSLADCAFTLEQKEVTHLTGDEREQAVLRYGEAKLMEPFNLSEGSLIRAQLIKLSEAEHVLYIYLHHIISDGWSISIIARELSTFYNYYSHGEGSLPDPLEVQYADFTLWQREWLQGDLLEKQLSYWKKELAEVPESLDLPFDKKRPENLSYQGNTYKLVLDAEQSRSLKKLGEANRASLFMVLLSGLNILLYRYTHQETIVVGTPIANRHFREIEGLVGFFINTLALKTDVKGEMSFVELLNEVREMTLKGYAHQDLPFEKLIDHLQIARSVNRQPLFQVMLTLQNNDPMEYSMQGLEVQSFDLDYPIAKFDLSLYATEQLDNTIHLAFEYATDLFEERTIVQLANHLVQILIAIIKYPNIRVGELPFLNINEQQQLLINWNQTKYPYPQYTTIHQLFELQVNKTPKDLAVLFEGQIFTYEMLNKVANQFAHYLHHLEIKKSTPIIVYLDHSIELIITLLGILKAGNIYTPADPKYYSQNRLEYLIQDTSSPVIITNKVIWNKVDLNLTNVLFWEDISGKMKACSGENLDCEISSEDTAYIIYTSGSTGLPKGVLGSHRGMINRLVWSWQTFPFKKDDVCYQKASINFVDHIAEYFSPLLYGIPLVLASKNVVNEVNIYQMIKDIFIHKVTRIVVVPSLLRVILEEGKDDISKLQSLRYIFCSGEALSVELANYTYTLLPEIELVNIYGSSEVSADVSYHCFVKQHSTVIKHFSENLQYMEAYLPLVKQNLVTTPFIQLESLKETFQANQIPILPVDFDEYRRYLDNYVLPYSVNTTASRFVGHMTSVMPKFVYDLNKLIVMLNQNLVKIETSKSFTLLEREAIAMLHHSFYEQPDSFYQEHSQNELSALGLVVSNGSIANISALWLARNHSLGADGHFKGIAEEGLNKALNHYGYQDCIVIASSLLHYSFEKAASLLGIGKRQIYHLPRTSDGEVNIDALRGLIIDCREKSIHIMAIVGIAGTTETGAIDPLFELSKIANEFSIHFHVDAAFGGPLIFSAKHKNLLAGIEHADSITICGHKQLYLSMGISICLFRNPDAANAILNTADYQATRESLDSGKISLEGSRSAMSILLHACLHLIGKKGYEELITTSINNTQYFRNIISSHGAFELILEPEINIINYRYIPLEFREKVKSCSLSKQDNEHIDKANILLQKQQFLQGQTFVSKTQVYVSKYQTELISLRAVLVNPLISENDLSAVLRDQLEIASKYIENKFDVLNNNFEITNITQNDLSNSYTVAIGRPIANTQMYILDKYLLPVPIGVVGQLYVGGANLSNGYLNQPMLTAEKFVPNPFYDGNDTTTRLYQTGDLARYLANGNIEYLGRVDDQIKIRGIRVELKEIETVVKNQTNIQNVVVVTRENSALQQQLIAYLVLSEGLMDTNEYIDNLRQELSKQLPEYMIPNAFIVLDQLPLNASGKIDKKALPLPTQFHSSTKEYIAPRNQIEQKLTEIWSALLNMKLSEISINESFFKLGGHSLLATRLISRINQVFNVKFELKNLFTLTTIMEIAANIQKSDISNLLDELDTDELNLIQFDEEEITLLKS